MAKRNVEVLRDIYAAFNRRDIDGLLEGMDDSIEIAETEDLGYAALLLRVLGPRFVILSGDYKGIEEVRRLFESVWEIAEWFEVEPGDAIEAGDSVVISLEMRARARATGIEGNASTVHRWTMRDGKAIRLQVFADQDEALAARESPD